MHLITDGHVVYVVLTALTVKLSSMSDTQVQQYNAISIVFVTIYVGH